MSSRATLKKGPTELSPRQLQILQMLADGHSRKEIAGRLFLTLSSVTMHINRIRERTELRTTEALVAHGFRTGLIT